MLTSVQPAKRQVDAAGSGHTNASPNRTSAWCPNPRGCCRHFSDRKPLLCELLPRNALSEAMPKTEKDVCCAQILIVFDNDSSVTDSGLYHAAELPGRKLSDGKKGTAKQRRPAGGQRGGTIFYSFHIPHFFCCIFQLMCLFRDYLFDLIVGTFL